MQTQKEIQRSLAVLKNNVLLLTVPVAIVLQNQPRTRRTQKHENKKKVKRVKMFTNYSTVQDYADEK